ncbi:MAG TPA: hypothetical protein VHU87_15690 [Rhizomicrobium sp.]|jgi:hypothetical protein|nr:hypothetical protein [Rhizomicrobium sp.]
MYIVIVVLLLGVLPAGSVFAEQHYWHFAVPLIDLIGKWFTFWAVGVRLFLAGLRQSLQPRFTAREIFNLQDDDALPIVRELGLANISMGALGLLSLALPAMTLPAAIVGGLYYGLAGALHIGRGEKNFYERFAMVTDLLIFVLLAAYIVHSAEMMAAL